MDFQPAIAHLPKPKKADICPLKALCVIPPPSGQGWAVYSYALNSDICTADGTPDNFYGLFWILGAYPEGEAGRLAAMDRARHITETTGQKVAVCKLGLWARLTLEPPPEQVTTIHKDVEGNIVELENQEFKKKQAEYARRYESEQRQLQETIDATQPHSLAHFKQNALLALKHQESIERAEKALEEAQVKYNKRCAILRDHYQSHPEHESEWLKVFRSQLEERGEGEHYSVIEEAYLSSRSKLLGTETKSSTSKSTAESLEKESAPSVGESTGESLETESAPSVVESTGESLEKESAPSVGESTAESLEKESAPSVVESTGESLEKESAPSTGESTADICSVEDCISSTEVGGDSDEVETPKISKNKRRRSRRGKNS
jgi:hypothetical protein